MKGARVERVVYQGKGMNEKFGLQVQRIDTIQDRQASVDVQWPDAEDRVLVVELE